MVPFPLPMVGSTVAHEPETDAVQTPSHVIFMFLLPAFLLNPIASGSTLKVDVGLDVSSFPQEIVKSMINNAKIVVL
jgi:hypothetical protein